jgi:hypothetical protein
MQYNKNEKGLTAENPAVQISSVHETDKGYAGMNLEQLNEYLVKKEKAICEYERKNRTGSGSKELRSIIEKQEKKIELQWETIELQWETIKSQARVIERLSVGTKQDNPDGPCKVIKMTPR